MISGRKSLVLSKKLLMLTVAHFVMAPVAFADEPLVLAPSLSSLELQDSRDAAKRAVHGVDSAAVVERPVLDSDAPETWEVLEDPKVTFAKNASNPLVSHDGRANPNLGVLQGSMLDLNDLSYLVAKSQSKKAELEALRSKLAAVKTEIDKVEAEDDPFGFDEEHLDGLYNERNNLGVSIQTLRKDLQENDARKDALQKEFVRLGWILKVFKGKTGYKPEFGDEAGSYVDDDRGIVAYDQNTRTFVVCYHGSRNQDDWKTNLDGKKIKASEAGLLLGDIEVHRGFAFAAASCTA